MPAGTPMFGQGNRQTASPPRHGRLAVSALGEVIVASPFSLEDEMDINDKVEVLQILERQPVEVVRIMLKGMEAARLGMLNRGDREGSEKMQERMAFIRSWAKGKGAEVE